MESSTFFSDLRTVYEPERRASLGGFISGWSMPSNARQSESRPRGSFPGFRAVRINHESAAEEERWKGGRAQG